MGLGIGGLSARTAARRRGGAPELPGYTHQDRGAAVHLDESRTGRGAGAGHRHRGLALRSVRERSPRDARWSREPRRRVLERRVRGAHPARLGRVPREPGRDDRPPRPGVRQRRSRRPGRRSGPTCPDVQLDIGATRGARRGDRGHHGNGTEPELEDCAPRLRARLRRADGCAAMALQSDPRAR